MKRTSTISLSLEFGLRFFGLWPTSLYPTLYWFSYMMTILVAQYFQYAYAYAHFNMNDLWPLMDCLSLTLVYTLTFFKLFVFWWNRRIFYCIVKEIEQDWQEGIINNSCVPTMMNMADLSRRFVNIVCIINGLSAFFLSIGEYLLQKMNADRFDNISREHPIKMKFPFEASKTPIFEWILLGQFIYDFGIAMVIAFMTALLVTLVLHVSGQIDILQRNLVDIVTSKYDRNRFLTIVKGLICKHQRIIALSENIENLYTYIALMQLLWNTVIIICTGFVIIVILSTGGGAKDLIKPVNYYIAITLEAFVICFAGEFLSAKSKSIGDAVYESLWYDVPPRESRILLMMILRCQKKLTITAGKVVDLTLEGFTNIMKASVSYVSILHAMY